MMTAGYSELAFVNRHRVGRHQGVELAKAVGDGAAIEAGRKLCRLGVHIVDVADVAIVDVLVVVVLDLHDLVARREGPAEAFDLARAGWVQRLLQFDVERARAYATT